MTRQAGVRLGFWAAVLTAGVAAVSLGLAVTTLPHSGPYCRSDCIGYPYLDAAAFVPRDYLWMYPAVLLSVLVVVLVACLPSSLASSRRVWGDVATCLGTLGAGILLVDYAVQLTVVQPALVRGETDGLSPWSQYHPYGVFIAFENVGYATLNIAFGFLGVGMIHETVRLVRLAGWVFLAGAVLTFTALIGYAAVYRAHLDYRFEVAAIGITWLVLITAPALLAAAFRRGGR